MQQATGRRYTVAPELERQWEELPDPDTPAFWQFVSQRDEHASDYVASEVLVRVMRRLLEEERLDNARRVATELIERWAGFIERRARRWFPNSTAKQEDFQQEVWARLLEGWTDPGVEFWEVNFIHTLRMLGLTVSKSLAPAPEVPLSLPNDDDKESIDPIDPQDMIDEIIEREADARCAEALSQLPQQTREVVFLKDILKWREASQYPSEMTISRALNMTDRTVRNHLKRGHETLKRWYEAQNRRED